MCVCTVHRQNIVTLKGLKEIMQSQGVFSELDRATEWKRKRTTVQRKQRGIDVAIARHVHKMSLILLTKMKLHNTLNAIFLPSSSPNLNSNHMHTEQQQRKKKR